MEGVVKERNLRVSHAVTDAPEQNRPKEDDGYAHGG